jgi:diguanylate cyclase (GGDEF)-like protein
LLERLQRELERAPADATPLAILFIDLDNFKLVNDSLGHSSGDDLLREMARRISACAAHADTVSRFGGDELVVLHPRAINGSEAELGARILAAVARPASLSGKEVVVSASVGVALCTPGTKSSEQLLREADTALYAAKGRGRARVEYFNEELHARVANRVQTEAELRVALRTSQLFLHYQPQVNLKTGRVVGVEALARWRHPTRGIVGPAEFIPVAEDCGLIEQLGRQVLWQSCQQLAAWGRMAPDRPLTMTVNVSPRQLERPGFVDDVEQTLDASGIRARALCLELTESAVIGVNADITGVLNELRQLGIYVAIDDFGTEHSSLARLRSMPAEILKIDRSFVDGLSSEPGDTAVVSSILSLAYAMGKHVIAEGVERAEQAIALRRMGCEIAQGYLFSRPVDAAEIEQLLDHSLWEASSRPALRPAVIAPDLHARCGYIYFIDEFLDHIGAPMGTTHAGGNQ